MKLFNFLRKVLSEFSTDRGSQLSAAFAYTSIFALAPFLIVIISVAGLVFGQRAAEGRLFSNITDLVGPNTAATIERAIAHIHQSHHSLLALMVGVLTSLLAASALTAQLQNTFDIVFAVVPDPRGGIKRMVYVKIKNALTLIFGSLIVAASVVFAAALSAAGSNLAGHLGMPNSTLQSLNLLASFAVFVLVLYITYRVLPDVRLPRRLVLTTAFIIGLLFLIGKIILGWVIGHNGTASAYGAAASLITLLLWFYYTGQILLLGAEGMKVYANTHKIEYRSKRYALRRKTINLTAKNDLGGRLVEKFARGYTRGSRD